MRIKAFVKIHRTHVSYKEFLEECKRTMRMSEAEVDGSEAVRCPQMGGGRKMYVFRLVD